MKCNHCGKEIETSAKFCQFCGAEVIRENTKSEKPDKNSGGKIRDYSIRFIGVIVGAGLGYIVVMGITSVLGVASLLALLFISITGLVGSYVGRWYKKRGNTNPRLVSILAWSNIITWLFPFVGMFTAGFTLNFSKPRKVYQWLAIIAVVLSVVNGAWGARIFSERLSDISENTSIPAAEFQSYFIGKIPVEIPNGSGISWTAPVIYNRGSTMPIPGQGRLSGCPAQTSGKFIEIEYGIVSNNTNTSTILDVSKMLLSVTDQLGRTYYRCSVPELSRATDSYHKLSSSNGINPILKPGIPIRFSEFFEVAKDSNTFQVIVKFPLR